MRAPSRDGRTRVHGSFFDGVTAAAKPVTVSVLGTGIQIYGEGGVSCGNWPYGGMRTAPGVAPETELNLLHRDHPDARLVITDAGVLGQIRTIAPQVLPREERQHGLAHRLALIALIIAILAGLVFVVIPQGAHVIAGAIPVDWETAWGKSFRTRLSASAKVCGNRRGADALEQLAAKLLATEAARAGGYDIDITVIEAKAQNAFATLGGQIVLFSDLIEKMEGPDELAGVLAHEIAHVVARHPLTHAIEALAATTLAAMFGGGGDMGGSAAGVGGALAVSAYSRAMEAEADAIAQNILAQARISPNGLADFFARLKRTETVTSGGALALFDSHPDLAERAARLRDDTGSTAPALGPREWRQLKTICG
ncbi:MAG: M48 family metallopeptidase [Alphaproteobacteria bacterium]|nr:M48 family metallopeptidase [Alphaproteobacteria bacterium]